ncbi:MAG TPA: PTS sugar transporter subunit IIA [bacterium]|nr:PTS transporter subunit EIIA [Myxococcales bacterium]HPW46177.1 PTS sugar transporter subunit IIA [bacterium]HQC51030.1 PTS sugar transporter subunit IIA [bacterium]
MVSEYVKVVPLGELLDAGHVIEDMTNKSKKAAIEDIIDLLYRKDLIPQKAEALKRVLEREDLAVTALGDGIAIPHARLEVGPKPVIAIGRHKQGIDFGAPDRGDVHIIVLILWQPEQPGLFNRLFAGLVSKLADPDFRDHIMKAKDAKEIAALFADVKVDMLAGRATKWEADILVTLQLLEAKKSSGAKGLARKIELARDELSGSMLSRFDRLISHYGEALVEANDGICHGCNMQLSSGLAYEMKRNPNSVYVCERCGRFIIGSLRS